MKNKVELHLHLDGSLRIDTVAELLKSKVNKKELIRALSVSEEDKTLVDYLKKFDLPIDILQNVKNLERVAYELVEDLANENTIYAEIRVAPVQHTKKGLTPHEIVKAILDGFNRGMEEFPIKVNLLLCAMRHLPVEDNWYLLDLVQDFQQKGVVGLDLAGDEAGYPVTLFKDFFLEAKNRNIPFTIHAGEAKGPESIIEAIKLGASRLGHGIRAYESLEAMTLIKNKNICLECCPKSNYDTNAIDNFNNYPIKLYIENNIAVTLNSDNRTVSNTNITKEINFLREYISLNDKDIMTLNLNAINHAFIPQKQKNEIIDILNQEREMELNKYIDHTVLKATTTTTDIQKLCTEAKKYNFYSVCVNGCYVNLAKKELSGTDVNIAAVIGFPLGAMSSDSKVFEAKNCIENGATEIDMVMNVGFMKSGMLKEIESEIKAIKNAIGSKVLKVILETCYLTKDEIKTACELSVSAGADFVKTSTGFGTGGATFEDVEIMKSIVDGKAQIKASGGVRDLETATKYINMGVTRLGTSSGVQLMTTGKAVEGQY